MRKRIVIVGCSFAGLTAAVRIKKHLGERHDVVVLSKSEEFLFMPSLIWVPFDLRTKDEISFPVRPILDKKGIEFKHVPVTEIRPTDKQVVTPEANESYDYLVIATGPKLNYAAVPGLGPHGGYTQSIFSWEDAVLAGEAFQMFLEAPGPVVIGAVQARAVSALRMSFSSTLRINSRSGACKTRCL